MACYVGTFLILLLNILSAAYHDTFAVKFLIVKLHKEDLVPPRESRMIATQKHPRPLSNSPSLEWQSYAYVGTIHR